MGEIHIHILDSVYGRFALMLCTYHCPFERRKPVQWECWLCFWIVADSLRLPILLCSRLLLVLGYSMYSSFLNLPTFIFNRSNLSATNPWLRVEEWCSTYLSCNKAMEGWLKNSLIEIVYILNISAPVIFIWWYGKYYSTEPFILNAWYGCETYSVVYWIFNINTYSDIVFHSLCERDAPITICYLSKFEKNCKKYYVCSICSFTIWEPLVCRWYNFIMQYVFLAFAISFLSVIIFFFPRKLAFLTAYLFIDNSYIWVVIFNYKFFFF